MGNLEQEMISKNNCLFELWYIPYYEMIKVYGVCSTSFLIYTRADGWKYEDIKYFLPSKEYDSPTKLMNSKDFDEAINNIEIFKKDGDVL